MCWSRVKCCANCRSNRSDNAGFTRLFRDVSPVKTGDYGCYWALPAAQIADGVDARVLLPAFPDIRRGIPDAQVVTRRDTFAGRITLLFGHYNGVGIYLVDAPHLYDRPGARITTPTCLRIPITCCVLRCWVGPDVKWPAALTHSGARMWCMRTTGTLARHRHIWRRVAIRRNRCSPYTTRRIKACFMQSIWMTSIAMVVL